MLRRDEVFRRWQLSYSRNSPTSNWQSMLTLVELICASIRYRESLRLLMPDMPKCPVTAVILNFHYFSLLFSFGPAQATPPSQRGTIPSDWCQVLCPFAETYPIKTETGPHLWHCAFADANRCNLWQNWHPYHGLDHGVYYHIFKTCFAFALTNWIIGSEMITVTIVHTPNFPPSKTPVTTTKISNAIRTNLICQWFFLLKQKWLPHRSLYQGMPTHIVLFRQQTKPPLTT